MRSRRRTAPESQSRDVGACLGTPGRAKARPYPPTSSSSKRIPRANPCPHRSPPLLRLWAELGIPADYAERRGLPLQREATKLAFIGRNADGRAVRLAPRAAAAWRRLHAAAAAAGVALEPVSGFRSVARQVRIIRSKLAAGEDIAAILRFVAAPGCSEHHTGRALDVGIPGCDDLSARFARTSAFRWLRRHAGRFGFRLSYPRSNRHGIGYEPWHWCWHPRRR